MRTSLSRFLAFSAAGVVALTAFSDDAFADRRSSLAGNMLITDQDDIYIYPQLTLEHRNLVSLDYFPGNSLANVLGSGAENVSGQGGSSPINNSANGGTNAQNVGVNNQPANGTANASPSALGPRSENAASLPNGPAQMGGAGLLLFGEENFAFGVSTHREDIYGATPSGMLGVGDLQLYGPGRQQAWSFIGYGGPIPATTNPTATPTPIGSSTASGGGGVFLQPLQLADILLGFSLGSNSSMGARLSVGQNTFREQRLGVDVEDQETWNTTALDLVVGFSMRGDFDLDLNLELGLAFFSDVYVTSETEPDYNDNGALAPSFSLSGRSLIDLRESIKLGVLGVVHVNSASVNDEFGVSSGSATNPNSTSFSSSNFFLEAGAGPVYDLPDATQIGAYGTIGFGSSNYSDEAQSFNTNALLLPGFKLAMEHWILDWLAFRSGLSSRYYFTFQSREFESDVNPNVSATSTFYEFLWSAGLGIAVGNFELNGTFQTPFVTNGPAILSGTGPGLWALLNATYKF
jgi:hypothetical protein